MAEEICFDVVSFYLIMTSMATVNVDDVQVVYIDLVLVASLLLQFKM